MQRLLPSHLNAPESWDFLGAMCVSSKYVLIGLRGGIGMSG